MTVDIQPVEVERDEAKAWIERSLRQGFDLSLRVLAEHVFDSGRFLALVPIDFERRPLNFAAGGVLPLNSAEKSLSKFLNGAFGRGAAAVVVEHDMMRASDPVAAEEAEPLAFVGERVLHWCDLRDGGGKGARTIIRGAHGYPLNAFLTSRSSADLGLVDRQQAPKSLPQLVGESILAVVVAAFDGESFLIWTRLGGR